jgi:hypothetical protein
MREMELQMLRHLIIATASMKIVRISYLLQPKDSIIQILLYNSG